MGALQDRLDAMREASKERIPAAAREVMHAATAQLVDSGAADRALGVGDVAPSFALPDTSGTIVRSEELLQHGPLVLTFFRGHW